MKLGMQEFQVGNILNLLNKNSIGIEITNPGHQHGYKNFSKKQIFSLQKLLNILIKKYKIKKKYVFLVILIYLLVEKRSR